MDFKDTPEEAAFREEVKAWLADNIPTSEELEGLDYISRAKIWQKRKHDAGWACIRWPKEHGGRDASAIQQVIWNQEEGKFDEAGKLLKQPHVIDYREQIPQIHDAVPIQIVVWLLIFQRVGGAE